MQLRYKVGIITIQKSEVNYGACLQSYALWSCIKSITGSCQVIDLLRPCHDKYKTSPSLGEISKLSIKQRIRRVLYSIFFNKQLTKEEKNRIEKFHDFNAKVEYSTTYRKAEDLYYTVPDYDIYVTGSDQVWNPKMPFLNNPYFLTFAPKDRKRVSYASSFGIDKIEDSIKPTYKQWLIGYDCISTREESGADIVASLIGNRPTVVLDPVFLLSKKQWRAEMKKPSFKVPEKYLLVYMLTYDEQVLQQAYQIGHTKNLPLILVLSENRIVQTDMAQQLVDIGPAEWMWLIDNADTMVTTSFHGTAFSIIFQTPIAVLLKEGVATNSRIATLMSRFNLNDHIHYLSEFIDWNNKVFDIKSDLLKKQYSDACNESMLFLTKALAND